MRRILLMFVALFVGLSLTGGAMAHAMEPIACVDNASAASLGHSNGDGDQVPSDSDKGYPHHHGGCHGHQVCDRVGNSTLTVSFVTTDMRPVRGFLFIPLATADPALRPPIA